jgi:streptogramin lyase
VTPALTRWLSDQVDVRASRFAPADNGAVWWGTARIPAWQAEAIDRLVFQRERAWTASDNINAARDGLKTER